MSVARIVIATILITGFGFVFHTLYGETWITSIIDDAAGKGLMANVIRDPYPAWFVMTAALTALIPAAFKVILYYFLGASIPFRNKLLKGATYGVILLAVGDNLIRMPIMQLLSGNPGFIVLLQSAEAWVIYIGSGIAIALIIPVRSHTSANREIP